MGFNGVLLDKKIISEDVAMIEVAIGCLGPHVLISNNLIDAALLIVL